ncbi:MAG: 4Fe-4S dicluster domain-containing protein [Chloroflexi bacterium]|nr:4Fe-4S dicluster domain-containing protein [Chloroflexota bacterium]
MSAQAPFFSGQDAPAEADIWRCVHCGLCLQSCPTYVQTGLETESPRGRISIMKAVHERRTGLTETATAHLELCLQCRACEAVCPSGVPFGRMMEATRAQIAAKTKRAFVERVGRKLAFRVLLPRPRLMRAMGYCLKLYQRTGLQWLVRQLRLLKPFGPLDRMDQQLPMLPKFYSPPRGEVVPALGAKKRLVAMLNGCVMPLTYGPVNEATARVLAHNGCEVVVPRRQGCCGALSAHGGEREAARALARKNIDVLLATGAEAVIVNSAGCGSAMKEYGDLLKDDSAYREKAERFGKMVKDANEFLAGLPLAPGKRAIEARVTYQDSCHLAHAQRIKDAPRAVLRAIPGLKLIEMQNADMCCGAAGVYNIVQPEMSSRLLEHKMEHVAAAQPAIIATANPGCMLQLQRGVERNGMRARVAHVVELLDESYRD